jgi:Cyclic nucleotide-binding domain
MSPLSIARPVRDCGSCELRSLRMFCNLDAEALSDFGSIGVQANLPKGAKLFREDDPSNGVFVICTGQVKLSCTSREGRTLILKIAMPGDVLGLGAVISGSTYEVTAETIEAKQIKSIRREDFLSFLQKQVCMRPRRSQRSTKQRSSMPGAWRCPVRRQAGLRAYSSWVRAIVKRISGLPQDAALPQSKHPELADLPKLRPSASCGG